MNLGSSVAKRKMMTTSKTCADGVNRISLLLSPTGRTAKEVATLRRFLVFALATASALTVFPLSAVPLARSDRHQARATTAAIKGSAISSVGQKLGNYTIRLRDIQTAQVLRSVTSDGAGEFSFTGLNPGNVLIEVLAPDGRILGTSTIIALAAGAMVRVTVTAAASLALAAAAAGELRPESAGRWSAIAVTVLVAAAAAGIIGVIGARPDASASR